MTKQKISSVFRHFNLFILATGLLFFAAACSSINTSETVAAQQSAPVENKQTRAEFDHGAFETLLKMYVNENGKVDYDGFTKDRARLDAYLDALGKADPKEFASDDERNAFFINAYNAFTIRDVLDDVYQKTDSVKKVDGFWDKKKHLVGGENLTLDAIEKISRDYLDPRVHFAVNCASSSCPKLQRFAFTGAKLNEQLEISTKDFLADESRGLKIDRAKKKVWISKIFSWYAGDFTGDTSGLGFVKGFIKSKFTASAGVNFIVQKVSPETVQYFKEQKPDFDYLEYDWTLNSLIPPKKK